jgi:hypothetical protein
MFGKETGGSRQGLLFNVWDYLTVFWETEGKYSSHRGDSRRYHDQDLSSEPRRYAADYYFKLCFLIVVASILTDRPTLWSRYSLSYEAKTSSPYQEISRNLLN